jgi:hypothetical protein
MELENAGKNAQVEDWLKELYEIGHAHQIEVGILVDTVHLAHWASRDKDHLAHLASCDIAHWASCDKVLAQWASCDKILLAHWASQEAFRLARWARLWQKLRNSRTWLRLKDARCDKLE